MYIFSVFGLRAYWFLFVSVFSFTTRAQTPDPGVAGPHSASKDQYNLGDQAFRPSGFPRSVEVKGVVHYPADLKNGPYPVVFIMHGRHETCYNPSNNQAYSRWPCNSPSHELPSYLGYDYFGSFLATHGFIVISVGANAIAISDNSTGEYGMNARAQLLQHHLTLWKGYNEQGSGPFGNKFIGALDMTNIGTLGHSRGGEGVIAHGVYNQKQANPYSIRAVMTVGATNYTRPVLSNVPIAPLIAYCDGDEPNLGGLHYYDDSRYLLPKDQTPKHTIVILGANHNYYNTNWTPGLFPAGTRDDWSLLTNSNSDTYCGPNQSGNKRLTASRQRATLIAYGAAFFRVYLGGETKFAPILETGDRKPPASSTLGITEAFVSYHAPASKRLDINKTNIQNTETLNSLQGLVSQTGLLNYRICGDALSRHFCLGVQQIQEPHNHYLGNTARLGLSQLQFQWNGNGDRYRNDIPAASRNFTSFKSLQFRAGINFRTSPSNKILDFSVQLKDASGKAHSEKVSAHSSALYFPPGNLSGFNPRLIHNTIQIPLSSFNNLDLTNITSLEFLFTEDVAGAILITDLALSSPVKAIVTGVRNPKNPEVQRIQILVSPNPARDFVHVKGLTATQTYEIRDISGALWFSGHSSRIDVSSFPVGLYFLQYRMEKVKFLIQG